MAEAVYILCAATSLFCAWLLFARYRTQRTRLLMWSSLCFAGLAVNCLLLVIDLVLIPQVDLLAVRTTVAGVAMILLMLGLIWESR